MEKNIYSLRSWKYAIKPASWPKILVPAYLGLSIGWSYQGLQTHTLLPSILLAVLLVISIVLCNDWADIKVDTTKRKMFPKQCSPKTIPDNILSFEAIKAGSLISILCFLTFGSFSYHQDFVIIVLIFSAVLFIQIYSFPPLKLNYRGGGEWVETIGVGVLLPLLFLRMTGLKGFPPESMILLGGIPSALASALASGLADEESDRIGGKKTFTTAKGHLWVRHKVLLCMDLTVFLWFFIAYLQGSHHPVVGALYMLILRKKLHKKASKTQTNKFQKIKFFKTTLHHSIWGAYFFIACSLLLSSFLRPGGS